MFKVGNDDGDIKEIEIYRDNWIKSNGVVLLFLLFILLNSIRIYYSTNPFNANTTKSWNIIKQFVEELFECGVGA